MAKDRKVIEKYGLTEWGEILVRALVRTVLICAVLYGAYAIKSALGINLSEHYHAIDLFQSPIDVLTDIVRA